MCLCSYDYVINGPRFSIKKKFQIAIDRIVELVVESQHIPLLQMTPASVTGDIVALHHRCSRCNELRELLYFPDIFSLAAPSESHFL